MINIDYNKLKISKNLINNNTNILNNKLKLKLKINNNSMIIIY